MNVSLTDELEAWIQAKVDSGLYRSSSEVVREALRRLREAGRREARRGGPRESRAATTDLVEVLSWAAERDFDAADALIERIHPDLSALF